MTDDNELKRPPHPGEVCDADEDKQIVVTTLVKNFGAVAEALIKLRLRHRGSPRLPRHGACRRGYRNCRAHQARCGVRCHTARRYGARSEMSPPRDPMKLAAKVLKCTLVLNSAELTDPGSAPG